MNRYEGVGGGMKGYEGVGGGMNRYEGVGIGTMNSLCVYVIEQGHLVKSMETGDSIVSSSLHANSLCVYVVEQGHLVKIPYVSM